MSEPITPAIRIVWDALTIAVVFRDERPLLRLLAVGEPASGLSVDDICRALAIIAGRSGDDPK